MGNKGKERELQFIAELEKAGKSFSVKNLKGHVETIVIDKLYHYGSTTKSKVDVTANNNYRLQIKSTNSNRASIINMVPFRNWEILAKREMLDIQPVLNATKKYYQLKTKTVRLADLGENKEDWREIIQYFLFEGTATSQADRWLQATHLIELTNEEPLLINKKDAVDYIWEKLYFEIRRRPNKNEDNVHIRVKG